MVGRERQIEQLVRHLESALSGQGITVFIGGEAGVGKTRLVTEFLNLAKKKGIKVLSGWCLSEAAIPYFPFTEAFNTYMSTISDAKAKTVMTKQLGITGWIRGPKSLEPKPRELFSNPEIERDRTFEAAAIALLQLSANAPTILFLDDLHWADHLSLALLHYIARKCRNSRLLIIGTYRLEELIRTGEEKLHPLEQTMFSMSREDLLVKMELGSLEQNDFPEFFKSIFGFSADEEFVKKLYKETEGNPLFALETLNLLAEEGFLSEKEGRWTLTAPTEKIGIPSKVHDVIVRRIGRLRREERKLLDLAAVCGDSFSPNTLCRVLALDITDVLQTLAEIERSHRLIHSADSLFEFAHQKIREVMYANLPGELKRVYHLKTASCLEQVLAEKISDGYFTDIAHHFVEGGAPERAFEYLVKLGEKAVNIYAKVQAIEYLNQALKTAQETPSLATSENLFRIYKLRGRAWLGHEVERNARNDFNLMLQNANNIGDESMIAEAHYWLGTACNPFFEERDDAMRHLKKAVEMARKTGNKSLEARSLGEIGGSLIATHDTIDEGRMRLEESSKIFREIGDKANEASNMGELGWYYNWKGEFNQAKENLNKAIALDEEAEVVIPRRMISKLWMLTIVLAGNGEYNDAISTGQRCLQLARNSGLVSQASWVLNTLGWIHHDLSNIELSLKYNNEAIEFARAHQKSIASGGVPNSLVNLGMDYLYKNDYVNAEKCFKEASSLRHQHPVFWWRLKTRIFLGLGEVALAKGNYERALKLTEDSLAISEKAGAKKYVVKGLKLKAETLAKMNKTEEAIDLMKEALKLAQQVGNPPILWQTHYSLGLLLEKHGKLQEANEHYAQAITLIEATAAKLNDPSLKNSLLTATPTKAIRDAYAKTKPT